MLITKTPKGLYCEQADFYIDPNQAVHKALITHAHSDHARPGSKFYLAHKQNETILRLRLGKQIQFQGLEYNKTILINGVKISFHPSGHIPGSAQIRFEFRGEVWVVSGDYKLINDNISAPFEQVKCHHFITESTFGLPIFNWQPQCHVFEELNNYWESCARNGENLLISAYSLGKSQRIIKHLDARIGQILCHPTTVNINMALKAAGFNFGDWEAFDSRILRNGTAIICPRSGITDTFIQKIKPYRYVSCSGWMAMRGAQKWENIDRGFVLSDHADFNELVNACKESQAENIYVTHGYTNVFAKYLNQTFSLNATNW
jgi:putative mRNA 3-end processing factor